MTLEEIVARNAPVPHNHCSRCDETFTRLYVVRHDTASRQVEAILNKQFRFCPFCGEELSQ